MILPMPSSTEIPMIDEASDTGEWVASILLKQQQALGQHFVEAAAWYTIDDICSIFHETTGKRLVFKEVSDDNFSASVGVQMCEAWVLVRDFAFFGPDAKERLNESLRVSLHVILTCILLTTSPITSFFTSHQQPFSST
jgi:hypothetical protein